MKVAYFKSVYIEYENISYSNVVEPHIFEFRDEISFECSFIAFFNLKDCQNDNEVSRLNGR